MAKTKITFFCQNCGAQHSKWLGQCSSCNQWNTIVEEVILKEEKRNWQQNPQKKRSQKALALNQIKISEEDRIVTNNKELDNVLGGGLVKGAVVLLGGEPGIGKSTLILQVSLNLPQRVLYVSGEESQNQIKMRGERLGGKHSNCLI